MAIGWPLTTFSEWMLDPNRLSNSMIKAESADSTMISAFFGTASSSEASLLEQEKPMRQLKTNIQGTHLRIAQKYNNFLDS